MKERNKKEIQRTEIKWNVYKRKLNKLIIIDKMVDDTQYGSKVIFKVHSILSKCSIHIK